MLLVQEAVRMIKLALREVVDLQVKSRISLGIKCARISFAAHVVLLCSKHVHSCAVLLVEIA